MAKTDLFDIFFKNMPDDSVTFIGTKLIIQIPESFFKDNISKMIRSDVSTLGIFDGYIFDDVDEDDTKKAAHHFTMMLPCNIILTPTVIDLVTKMVDDLDTGVLTKENIYNMIFLKDDTFIRSRNLIKDLDISDHFINIMLNGKIPETIKYDYLPILWQQCADMNGSGSLDSNFNMFAIITMNLTRDPKDLTVPFRYVYDKYYAKNIHGGKMLHYWQIPKYAVPFTALTSTDPKQGITISMTHNDKDSAGSPVEEVIK
jgi:hypothetical protein